MPGLVLLIVDFPEHCVLILVKFVSVRKFDNFRETVFLKICAGFEID